MKITSNLLPVALIFVFLLIYARIDGLIHINPSSRLLSHKYSSNRIRVSSYNGENLKLNKMSLKCNSNSIEKPLNKKLIDFFKRNWLILGEVLVILIAKHNPSWGRTGGILKPEITISKLGVFTIFFINGVALNIGGGGSSSEVLSATKTNTLIQLFSYGFIPLVATLFAPYYPDPSFRDGLIVLSCLPTTINICVAQTLASGCDMGTAIFNAIFGNVLGVFLTPILVIYLLGAGKGISLLSTLNKLGFVVILPLILGQLARRTQIGTFFQQISSYSRTLSSCLLLAIVFNVFSDTFTSGIGVGGGALFNLGVITPLSYLAFSGIFWLLSKKLLPGIDTKTRGAALLCSSQKTLAFGIPFIKTAFGTRSDIAYILAPLLLYAPAQLLLGSSIFVPILQKKIRDDENFSQGGGI